MKSILMLSLLMSGLSLSAQAHVLSCEQVVGGAKIKNQSIFPGNVALPFRSGATDEPKGALAMNAPLDETLLLPVSRKDSRPWLQVRMVSVGVMPNISARVINGVEKFTITKSEIATVGFPSDSSASDYSIPDGVTLNLDPALIQKKTKVKINFTLSMEDGSTRDLQCVVTKDF